MLPLIEKLANSNIMYFADTKGGTLMHNLQVRRYYAALKGFYLFAFLAELIKV